jgi:hypothetical protein
LAIYESPAANLDGKRHWCFESGAGGQVGALHVAGLADGKLDDGAPGLRVRYYINYFGALLHDQFGNRVEAICQRAE